MFSRILKVLPSDASCTGYIKLRSLLNYFQDSASLAVEDLEGNTSELFKKGFAWILTKYEIDFFSDLPKIDEEFILNTFHDPEHGFNSLRVFQVVKNNILIAQAKTSWILFNLNSKRPVKPVQHLPELLKRDTKKITLDFHNMPAINSESECVKEFTKTVKFHDCDYNLHVNNSAYFEWIFDNAPAEINLLNSNLKYIYASFRSGAKLNENVKIQIYNLNNDNKTFMYKILHDNNNFILKPSAMFLCKWF